MANKLSQMVNNYDQLNLNPVPKREVTALIQLLLNQVKHDAKITQAIKPLKSRC
jgi:hypothetical protein